MMKIITRPMTMLALTLAPLLMLTSALACDSAPEIEIPEPEKPLPSEDEGKDDGRGDKTLHIEWDKPVKATAGGYARVHAMNDGRHFLVYARGSNACMRFSSDGCRTWSDERTVIPGFSVDGVKVNMANAECIRLSVKNPHRPGRMLYAVNHRPADGKSSVYPYSIAVAVSDDSGASWKPQTVVYSSDRWTPDKGKGCWEPFLLELPDGRVQVYFSDETPYFRSGRTFQNISMLESSDGGETWTSEPKIVCYTESKRDGMPVAMVMDGRIYVSIEANPAPTKLHPQIVCTSLSDNWSSTVGGDSPFRFEPFSESLHPETYYAGAPYLICTEKYIIICYQYSKGGAEHNTTSAAMEVQICPRSEVAADGTFRSMRSPSRPFPVDQSSENCLWNSLCDLGGGEVLAVGQWKGAIWTCRGTIFEEIPE